MKKAELQMQETILVLFIVTIIIGLALFTFYQFQLKSIESSRYELEQNKNLVLLSTLPNSVQLSYSYLGDEKNAIDTLKLLKAKFNDLGFKDITVKQVYPSSENKKCNIESYPECSSYQVYSKRMTTSKYNTLIYSTPISLYFPYTNEYKAGVLEIKYYY